MAALAAAVAAAVSLDEAEAAKREAFECNICLELASSPVVTLCGHLYCWPCLYRCAAQGKAEWRLPTLAPTPSLRATSPAAAPSWLALPREFKYSKSCPAC